MVQKGAHECQEEVPGPGGKKDKELGADQNAPKKV